MASGPQPYSQRFAARIRGTGREYFVSSIGAASQSRGTIGIFHTFLGHDGLGAVEWR